MEAYKKIVKMALRILGWIIRPSDRIWVFGAWSGKIYADNSKYLFEYLNQKQIPKKLVWISGDKGVVNHVRSLGYRSCYRLSLPGLWYTLRAGVAFETEGEWDIFSYLDYHRCQVIQLWHGMGMKAMKWGDTLEKSHDRFAAYRWMATSDLYTDIFTELMRIPRDIFTVTGYPRNDTFITKPVNETMEALKRRYADCKLLIYMPTHRNFGAEGNEHINIDALRAVNDSLAKKHMVMVYKPHIHELKNFLQYESEFSNIILAKEEAVWGDVYSYLHYFDLLITDYSSVATDFMCSGKPVVYFPYDVEDYKTADAGLNDYFWEIPGGPMCDTWDAVLEQAKALLDRDTWQEERERCRRIYHRFNDGNNCERVYQTVLKIIEEKKK